MINRNPSNPFGFILGILLLSMLFYGIFVLASFVFKILAFLAPFLLIAAFFINKKVVLDYVTWVWTALKERPFMGIFLVLVSVFGYAIVSTYLFGKAVISKRIEEHKEKMDVERNGEFVEFEELSSEQNKTLDLDELTEKVKKYTSRESGDKSEYL